MHVSYVCWLYVLLLIGFSELMLFSVATKLEAS